MRNRILGGVARCSPEGRTFRIGEVEAKNAPSGAGLSRTQVGSGAVIA